MKRLIALILVAVFVTFTFGQSAKFLPKNKKILLIIGQDLGSVGGFNAPNNNGYYENVNIVSGGITTYTGIPYLGGLKNPDNWGAGDVCAQYIIENTVYKNSAVVIGLSMKNHITNIKNGGHDDKIMELGNWIRDAKRPVYVRIGYEFNGGWNNYNPQQDYIAAFQRVVDLWRDAKITNFASVWQSSGYESADPVTIMNWYPGDDYVDWLGYSHFHAGTKAEAMLSLAKSKGKPIMAAEVTPKGYKISDLNTSVWSDWFTPFFKFINENKEYVRAVAYINANWDVQPMWSGQGWGDTRVEANATVLQNWKTEIQKDIWLNSSPDLFNQLGFNSPIRYKNYRYKSNTVSLIPDAGKGRFILSGISADKSQIKITNLLGKEIRFTLEENRIQLHDISSGIYFLTIKKSNGTTYCTKCLITSHRP